MGSTQRDAVQAYCLERLDGDDPVRRADNRRNTAAAMPEKVLVPIIVHASKGDGAIFNVTDRGRRLSLVGPQAALTLLIA